MRIQKRHKRTKRALLVAFLVVLVAAGSVAAVPVIDKVSKGQKDSTSEKKSDNKSKPKKSSSSSSSDADAADGSFKEKAEAAASAGDQTPPQSEKLEVMITSKNVSGGKLVISAQISAILGSGECKLVLTNNGNTATKTSGIQAWPQSSTCQGFEVPTSELGSGKWQVNLTVQSGNRSGSASTEVNI
jgi:hypothetical protein